MNPHTHKSMKTFGIKLTNGEIIKVRARNDSAAKVKAGLSKVHSVWQIGKYWDEKGERIIPPAEIIKTRLALSQSLAAIEIRVKPSRESAWGNQEMGL